MKKTINLTLESECGENELSVNELFELEFAILRTAKFYVKLDTPYLKQYGVKLFRTAKKIKQWRKSL